MRTPIEKELEITLESALLLAEEGVTLPSIAARLYDSERALISQFEKRWILDRLLWMLKRKRRNVAVAQLPLPGFEKLPQRIVVKGGHREALRFATLLQLKQYRAVLWVKQDGRVKALDALIDIVGSYAVENPNVRVVEALEREAARRH